MDFGTFSVSLAVKDMDASLDFYEKMGFDVIDGGHMNKDFPDSVENGKWRILEKDDVHIGLFEGMFETNIMTFNPTNVRAVQNELLKNSITLTRAADEGGSGPDFITLEDPDGNQIMFDQHQ